MIDMCNNPQVL